MKTHNIFQNTLKISNKMEKFDVLVWDHGIVRGPFNNLELEEVLDNLF